MGQTERITATEGGPTPDDAWAGGQLPEAPAPPSPEQMAALEAERTAAMSERVAAQQAASDQMDWAVHQIAAGVQVIQTHLALATEAQTDTMNYPAMAEVVDWFQNVKRTLGECEAYVARELGRADGVPEFIELPDGRRAEVMKGRERKAWRHEDWKRDVATKLVDALGYSDLVTSDGDVVPAQPVLGELIAKAQAVHGSAAPKSTALKALELSADDYCQSAPGPYSVKISAPATEETD